MSLSRDDSSTVHSPSAYWTTKVTTTGFQLCERAGSTNGTRVINWVALQADKRDITHGSVTFSGIWTTETKCDKVTFSKVRQLCIEIVIEMFRSRNSFTIVPCLKVNGNADL